MGEKWTRKGTSGVDTEATSPKKKYLKAAVFLGRGQPRLEIRPKPGHWHTQRQRKKEFKPTTDGQQYGETHLRNRPKIVDPTGRTDRDKL